MTSRESTDTRLTVGIIGLGFISEYHTTALRKLFGDRVHLIGVDLSAAVRDGALASGQVDSVEPGLDELVERSPDVVHVLVPPQHHERTALTLIDAGIDVLMEKPLAISTEQCDAIRSAAEARGVTVGVGHNHVFQDSWDRARTLIADGGIGTVRAIDHVSRRPLGFLRVSDTRPWMMQGSTNILFEVAPHAFAQVLDVLDDIEVDSVNTFGPVDLANGVPFHTSWSITGHSGDVPVTVGLSFDDAFAQSVITVRGTLGTITVDLDLNTLDVKRRSSAPFDAEKFNQAVKASASVAASAVSTMGGVIAGKAGIGLHTDPFAGSIQRSIEAFHAGRSTGRLDERNGLDFGRRVVGFAEQVAAASGLSLDTAPPERPSATPEAPLGSPDDPCDVVVFGGTGFIGAHLVRRLASEQRVRVIARSPDAARRTFAGLDVDVVGGDLRSLDELPAAVAGMTTVYNLSFGGGTTWHELENNDVEPALALADACEAAGVKRMVYASSIAIYNAGRAGDVVTEATPADPDVLRVAPYARSKAVVEDELLKRYRAGRLNVVVARPGVVLGVECAPCHWGIAAWPHTNVCQHWGSGEHPLPLVMVDDVADALAAMATVEGIEGESFNLCAETTITAREYVDELERCSGTPIVQETTRPRARHLSSLAMWSVKRLGSSDTPVPAYADAAGRTFAARFDCSKARVVLGWEPQSERDELLRRGVCDVAEAWS